MSQNIRDNSKPKPSSSAKRGAASDIRSFFGAKPKVTKRRSDETESREKSEESPLGNQPESSNLGT